MIIDLKQLKNQPGGVARFTVREILPDALLGGVKGRFLEAVEADLEVSFTGRVYIGQGTLSTRLEFPCSRCLVPHTVPIKEPLHLTMMDAGSPKADGLKDDVLLVKQGEADIEPGVVAALFSVIPFKPLCSTECLGLCPRCGVNRNKEACLCRDDNSDTRWEALKRLIREGGE